MEGEGQIGGRVGDRKKGVRGKLMKMAGNVELLEDSQRARKRIGWITIRIGHNNKKPVRYAEQHNVYKQLFERMEG